MSNSHTHYEVSVPRIRREGDDIYITDTGGSHLVLSDCYEMLAQWFREQEDERAGRTRIADHPHLVAYTHGPYHAVVVNERNGSADTLGLYDIRRGSEDPDVSAALQVARANIAPRVPTWHLAEPGELWMVEWSGKGKATITVPGFVVCHPFNRENPMFALVTAETVDLSNEGIKFAELIEPRES